MPKYKIIKITRTLSPYTPIEANSEDEAIKLWWAGEGKIDFSNAKKDTEIRAELLND